MAEKNYVKGIYFNQPPESAPDFVLSKVGIHRDKAIEWLQQQAVNEKGYLNADLLRGRDGKPYMVVDDWQPTQQPTQQQPPRQQAPAPMPAFDTTPPAQPTQGQPQPDAIPF